MSESLHVNETPVTGSNSSWAVAWRRFRRNPVAILALTVVIIMILSATVGGQLWIYSYTDITPDLSQPPSRAHPFGTDTLGHDMLALVLRGLHQSLAIAFLVAIPATILGVTGGVVAGFLGGKVDTLIMRLVDLILTIPSMALASFLGSRLRGESISTVTLALVLAALLWTSMARLVRGITMTIRSELYIDAAVLMGASNARIILRHVLPNVLDQVIVSVTLLVGTAVMSESGLSFLGFGIRPPDTSLGLLVSTAKNAATTRPWTFYFPGLAILVFVLAINFLGESLRQSMNPHGKGNGYLSVRRSVDAHPSPVSSGDAAAAPVEADEPLVTALAVDAVTDTVAFGDTPLLIVDHLSVTFTAEKVVAVDDLSFELRHGEVLALVGESGSGKTVTVSSITGLLPTGASVEGKITFDGQSLRGLDYNQWRTVRGSKIGVILQDPMTSLNPVLTIFHHFKETMQALGQRPTNAQVKAQALEVMRAVGITRSEDRLYQYPQEFSGGMRQRVVIALAVIAHPALIIADEPTTALDVTVQARVLDTLEQARQSVGAAMIFITHDLSLAAGIADRVLVMNEGRLVEVGSVDDIFYDPHEDYTRTLIDKVPRLPIGAYHD